MDETMTDKLMYIPNDDTQNFPLCGFQLVFETLWTNHSTFNDSPQSYLTNCIRKCNYKTLETSIKNIPMSPSSLQLMPSSFHFMFNLHDPTSVKRQSLLRWSLIARWWWYAFIAIQFDLIKNQSFNYNGNFLGNKNKHIFIYLN